MEKLIFRFVSGWKIFFYFLFFVFVVGAWGILFYFYFFIFYFFLYLLWERGVCLQNVPKPVGGGK